MNVDGVKPNGMTLNSKRPLPGGGEGGECLAFFCEWHVPVAIFKIYCGKIHSPSEFVQRCVDLW